MMRWRRQRTSIRSPYLYTFSLRSPSSVTNAPSMPTTFDTTRWGAERHEQPAKPDEANRVGRPGELETVQE